MTKLFFALGIFWMSWAGWQFFTMRGDPDRNQVVLQFLGMAALNLFVALVLSWMKERRERSGL